MNSSALTDASVYTDLSGLSRLRAEAKHNSPEALRAAARQFEALFLQMTLKSMREASTDTGEDSLFGSDQEQLYRDMYDKQIALEMVQGRGIGLADMLVRQLQGAVESTAPAPQPRGRQGLADVERQTIAAAATAAEKVAAAPVSEATFATPEDFVRTLWPHAQRAGDRLGVDPRALLAQAALETGWGKAVIRRPDGSSSYNLFNIKADQRWDGALVFKETVEYRDGVAAKERAPFRAYGSYAASFEDYVGFIQSQPRYRDALAQASNPSAFVRELHRAGYATDPKYAEKINDIMGRDLLAGADLKNMAEPTLT
jgi:flagellar protein FlgJ